MTSAPVWLTGEQQGVWRSWLRLNTSLAAVLQRELQEDAGLSSPDFEVLVNLTDSPEGRLRFSELADLLTWDRSRVSHHVKRMERRGLVGREECGADGRGVFVVLTPTGRDAIESAAPAHVALVRRLVFDALDADELAGFSSTVDKLLGRIEQQPECEELADPGRYVGPDPA